MNSQNLSSVLTAFPALTSPLTVLQAVTLSNNVAQIQNWNDQQVAALSVLSLAYLLNHAGGTNYTANLPQLATDATAFMGGFSPLVFPETLPQFDRFQAVIDWNAAYAAGATSIGTNINTLLTNIGFLQDTPFATLMQYDVYLRYACSIKGV
jgi:hypothetical protein